MSRGARLLTGLFCWITAVYAFLSASSFTYQQFLRPRVFAWVGWFSDHHAQLFWVWLAVAVLSLLPDLRSRATRPVSIAFVVVWSVVGLVLVARPVLPSLVDSPWSVVVGLIALAPLVWLAAVDAVATREFVRAQTRRDPPDIQSMDARLCTASFGAALFVVVLYAALTPIWIGDRFEPDLLTTGLLIGISWSAIGHLLIFGSVFLALAVLERGARFFGFGIRASLALGAMTIVLAAALQRLINSAIGLRDAWGVAGAAGMSASMVATWAGLRLRRWASEDATLDSGLDLMFGPAPRRQDPKQTAVRLLAVAILAFVLATAAARIDWDFLLLKLTVLFIWIAAFDVIYRGTPADVRFGTPAVLTVCLLPLAGHVVDRPLQARLPLWLGAPGSTIAHTLERYVIYNPSFRLADDILRDRPAGTPSFDRLVRANTGIGARIEPVSIDFVPHLEPMPMPPHVFWLVVDSLRADYLGPYNDAVRFTPNISAVARDSLVFHNAFTRYGGTGLSMSAMWMGAAGPHKQYVRPFAPMNALEKLLDANGYRRLVSMDHIMEQLLTPSPLVHSLDAGHPELEYDLCRTLDEIRGDLESDSGKGPLFAHTRSLNLHVAAVKSGAVPEGETYPGFHPPYAARVHRLDGCFGTFVTFLKRRGLWDRSIVVLTSDHGEMLGEDRQWGHAYYLYPQVLQTPLLIHVPESLRRQPAPDTNAIAFSTDITPTLYALLGYRPERANPLLGRSLVGSAAEAAERRRATEVVAASYGAVWGSLTENGRRLYVVDANHSREYAYERPSRGEWAAVPVTNGIRSRGQRAIRQEIERIAQTYHLGTTSR
jgi:sulfatase-like protein